MRITFTWENTVYLSNIEKVIQGGTYKKDDLRLIDVDG